MQANEVKCILGLIAKNMTRIEVTPGFYRGFTLAKGKTQLWKEFCDIENCSYDLFNYKVKELFNQRYIIIQQPEEHGSQYLQLTDTGHAVLNGKSWVKRLKQKLDADAEKLLKDIGIQIHT